MVLPTLAITLGDPSGIGPEITAKALLSKGIYKVCRPVVVGDIRFLKPFIPENKKLPCRFVHIPSDLKSVKSGKISAASGHAAYSAIVRAVELAKSREVSGIVTSPISKAALSLAGCRFPGHTELLASLTNTKDYAMMMLAENYRTVMVTRHMPLSKVPSAISVQEILRAAVLSDVFLKKNMGIKKPAIGICALNPHAGEGGILGTEDQQIILPAIKKLQKKGINAAGPLPSDSAWRYTAEGRFDLLLTMYHDQAMIGLKCLLPRKVVNVTIGLPFIRTSPGHGTAMDIAGKNTADPQPMIESIKLAALLCKFTHSDI